MTEEYLNNRIFLVYFERFFSVPLFFLETGTQGLTITFLALFKDKTELRGDAYVLFTGTTALKKHKKP